MPLPPLPPGTRARLPDLCRRLAELEQHAVDWWLARGVDERHGGFVGTLDAQGRPCPPTDKGLIQQSRHLWTFATYAERRSPAPRIREVVDRTYRFLVDHFLDPSDGEFFYMVSESGTPVDRMKKLYAESFAIYGLSAYGRACGVDSALDQALACFRSIDARAHDAAHGGYDQSAEELSWIDGLPKGTNTHIHLLESFTELLTSTDVPTVRERLSELATLIATRLLQPTGYVHQAFEADWTPAGDPVVSYGHDLETAWLLMDAARALGRTDDPVLQRASITMGVHAAERGIDVDAGGYFNVGIPGGAVTDREKIWWIQFEALAGLWWLHRLTGDPVHLDRLERTLAFIETDRDPEHGEWFFGRLPDGSFGKDGSNKGQEWKASYHNLRALMFVADWMAPFCE